MWPSEFKNFLQISCTFGALLRQKCTRPGAAGLPNPGFFTDLPDPRRKDGALLVHFGAKGAKSAPPLLVQKAPIVHHPSFGAKSAKSAPTVRQGVVH